MFPLYFTHAIHRLYIDFPLLQKLLEERSPVSLSSPPAKSCPNIAVRCDIVEYLWSPHTTLQHHNQTTTLSTTTSRWTNHSVLQFLIWQLLNPSCFLECDPCCCHGPFSYTFCHNASGNYLFSGAFAYIRDSIVKFRNTLPLEHCSNNRVRPILYKASSSIDSIKFNLSTQIAKKNTLFTKQNYLSEESFLICFRLSPSCISFMECMHLLASVCKSEFNFS